MKTVCMVLCGGLLAGMSSWVSMGQQPEGGLAGLYQEIIAGFASGNPPTMVAVTDYLDKVPAMSVDEVRSGLPWIEAALNSPRVEVRHYAGLGLFMINRRPDSRSLIEYLVPVLAEKLHDPEVNTRIWAIRALSEMKPLPPDSAISSLVQDLQAEKELAPGIVFGLVQVDPNREDIAAGIADYMTSQMTTSKDQIDTLNALATKPVHDARLIALIAGNLASQSDDVKIAAIQALGRSGSVGIAAAKPQLQQLAESPEASDRVRAAARQVLQRQSEKQNP